ncbi:MAG: hypothetical protein L3K03_00450 [Thermoplasmata archaeon]|nr:hypothetical protein [Thermoplasmata archaeon]
MKTQVKQALVTAATLSAAIGVMTLFVFGGVFGGAALTAHPGSTGTGNGTAKPCLNGTAPPPNRTGSPNGTNATHRPPPPCGCPPPAAPGLNGTSGAPMSGNGSGKSTVRCGCPPPGIPPGAPATMNESAGANTSRGSPNGTARCPPPPLNCGSPSGPPPPPNAPPPSRPGAPRPK